MGTQTGVYIENTRSGEGGVIICVLMKMWNLTGNSSEACGKCEVYWRVVKCVLFDGLGAWNGF